MTGSNQTWKLVMEESSVGRGGQPQGIFDVHSGSDKNGLDRTPIADW